MKHTNLLIVGAGPFGLALAAYARRRQADYVLTGKPMEFWQKHMPDGMFLRSGTDWHLDPDNVFTIERYAASQNQSPESVMPISLAWYLSYTDWFIRQVRPTIQPDYVTTLRQEGNEFVATLTDRTTICAKQVVLATGFGYFTHEPADVTSLLPPGSYRHTCHAIDMPAYRGRRVLLLGGRQSAFEWAALLTEAGASAVHVSYRHETPDFAEADWSWVSGLVDRIVDEPDWFRQSSPDEQAQHRYRLWAEGRLKVEPWLENRLPANSVFLHPRTRLTGAVLQPDGAVQITLDSGESFVVDDIILATGYQVDINRLPYLAPSLLAQIDQQNGFPQLDTSFQSSVPGLYVSSFPAGNDFGPYFGFTIAVRAAAQVIGRAVVQ